MSYPEAKKDLQALAKSFKDTFGVEPSKEALREEVSKLLASEIEKFFKARLNMIQPKKLMDYLLALSAEERPDLVPPAPQVKPKRQKH